MSTKNSPRIAIIGSGPAGLTLARLLRVKGIDTTVFEREPNDHSRFQGGTLDLHPATGQMAMKEAGLWDQFQKHARYDGQDLVIEDNQNNIICEIKEQDIGKPEIDRIRLRQILLESLPKDYVKWNHNLRKAEPGVLHFEHGTESGFDLIVGADGAWSKIRPLVTDVTPFYSGISGMDTKIDNVDERFPETGKWLGRGGLFAFDNIKYNSLKCQKNGDGSVRVYAFGRKPLGWEKHYAADIKNPSVVRQAMLKEHEHWDPKWHTVLENVEDDMVPRTLYMLPPGLQWPSRPGVTLIGDAAHLMTPFAGEGVNTAMTDALVLANSISAHLDNLDVAVKEYEKEMFERAHKVTAQTWTNLHSQFGEDVLEIWKKIMVKYSERAAALKQSRQS